MIGANRAFVRKLRRERLAAYFAYWRALGAQVEEHLGGHRAIGKQPSPCHAAPSAAERPAWLRRQIRSGQVAYHMIRLAMSGAAYCLGARVNPVPSLERMALLIRGTIEDPEI
ncbi:MAG TPA: hypothetical protein VGZ73_28045 [Bryobacteraceae bacterium]|nr:hypothetical protein [Bryobacteraceae bacterium]